MFASDMIAELEYLVEYHGDFKIKVAFQPGYPMESTALDYVIPNDETESIYIVIDGHTYLNNEVREELREAGWCD